MMDYSRIKKKITTVLFLSQGLSSAGFIAAFTVNAIVAVNLSGKPSLAGLPGALYVLGMAFGALIWGLSMERIGRRKGLVLGQVIGVIGSGLAMQAIFKRSLTFFLIGLVLVGIARAAIDLGRFAAAEVHFPEERGRAISNVVLGSTVGAVIGPLLVGPTGRLALEAGFPELAGPYSVSFVGLILAAGLIFIGLRPDPRDIGREISRGLQESLPVRTIRTLPEIVKQPGVFVAMISMIFAQMVMVVPMSITSVHMKAHEHPLSAISMVVSAHTLGMFAFSLISGRLTDKWGRGPVIILGSLILILSCLMAAPSEKFLPLVIALFFLGLGWNFAYVAGSALLADQLAPEERAKTQGFNDLLLNLGSAASQLSSGVVFAFGGYLVMAMTAAVLALVPLIAGIWWQRAKSKTR
ncbi:MAG: MFS transporter [Deltaproteobacteria bacterium]|nr:MFS transporter [Deltaproteobacteria bacterium]